MYDIAFKLIKCVCCAMPRGTNKIDWKHANEVLKLGNIGGHSGVRYTILFGFVNIVLRNKVQKGGRIGH